MSQKGFALVPLIIVLLLIVAGIGYFLISKGMIKNPLQSSFSNADLGSQIFQKVQNSSDEGAPDTNPFAKANPFKGVYKNPFE